MFDNIIALKNLDTCKNAETVVAAAVAQQLELVKNGKGVARVAYCDSVNNMLPVLLNGAGVYMCVFAADTDAALPAEPFFFTKGDSNRVLSYKMKHTETFEDVLALFNTFGETFPDFVSVSADDMAECAFEAVENVNDIYISENNVKISAFKNCEDGSGDIVFRVFETGEKIETRLFITSEKYDFGFWLDIRKGEVKTFRAGKDDVVRETNFLEGIAPFDEMVD